MTCNRAFKKFPTPFSKINDLTGERFGKLVAVAPCCQIGKKEGKTIFWVCACDCGNQNHVVHRDRLLVVGKKNYGCGCNAGGVTHGAKRGREMTPTYQSWRGMKERCVSPSHAAWNNYGGRGIKVCDRWLGKDGFSNFLSDMGERPGKEYTLDRIDYDKDYAPENCKWSTRTEQARNTRQNKIYVIDGIRYCETELCEKHGINLRSFRNRLRRGWTLEQALLTPVRKTKYA